MSLTTWSEQISVLMTCMKCSRQAERERERIDACCDALHVKILSCRIFEHYWASLTDLPVCLLPPLAMHSSALHQDALVVHGTAAHVSLAAYMEAR